MDTAQIALATVLCLLVAGCATLPLGRAAMPAGIPCSAGPIALDEADHLTRGTAEQIVTLNETGAELCHWQAP